MSAKLLSENLGLVTDMPKLKNYETIVWDFNGTIIDDVNAAVGAVNDMLIKRSQPTIDVIRYRSEVDIPISRFYDKVFLPGTIDFSDAIVEFDSGYDKYLSDDPVMPGALQMLCRFKSMGKHQIIVSASNIEKVTNQLSKYSLLEYFDKVLARSDYNVEDKTYLAQNYFREKEINPDTSVVIGDCVADWQMSRGLCCDCILTTNGHQSREDLEATDAVVIDNLTELLSLIC